MTRRTDRVDPALWRVPVRRTAGPEVRYRRAEHVDAVPDHEVEDQETWRRLVHGAAPLTGLRLQGLDLTADREALLSRDDLADLVVLGGVLDPGIEAHLRERGAVIFPADPSAPVDPYRAHLYTPAELYAGLAERGYASTVDARAYAWFEDATVRHDVYVTVLRSLHDDAMQDAVTSVVDGRRVVGVMGGHAVRRGSVDFAAAALLGHRLAEGGALVVTGGGPGAMEAANLGAWAQDEQVLARALERIAAVPEFAPSVADWVTPALQVRAEVDGEDADGQGRSGGVGDPGALRSLGVPTWYYGHEPPNAFAQLVAKFFSNALREDLLLAHARDGLVVLPGAAGTVQEVFQMATRLYYEVDGPDRVPPLVLVGREHWTAGLPVWPLLQALGRDRRMGEVLHLVDTVEEAAELLG